MQNVVLNRNRNKIIALIWVTLMMVSCDSDSHSNDKKFTGTNECGCNLSKEEMIAKLPIFAMGDSIKICKVGTNRVIGSGPEPMTWLEYLQSEYHGGEGQIYNCTINKPFKKKFRSSILKYDDKSLIIYYRFPIDVYDPVNGKWIDLDLETYKQRIYAKNDSIVYSKVEVAFNPPLQTKEAFKVALNEYEVERKKRDHYLISRTVKRLFVSAVNGDRLSIGQFLGIPDEFKSYYDTHPESLEIYKMYKELYVDYTSYLENGGTKEYYDLTIFPYFKSPEKYKN